MYQHAKFQNLSSSGSCAPEVSSLKFAFLAENQFFSSGTRGVRDTALVYGQKMLVLMSSINMQNLVNLAAVVTWL